MGIKTNVVAIALTTTAAGLVVANQAGAVDNEPAGTITYVAAPQHVEFVDLGTPGPSPGDYHTFTNDLSIDGERVGHDGGSCINTRVTDAEVYVHCSLSAVLPEGQLTIQLLRIDPIDAPPTEPFTGAVTGGTGAFTGASGTVSVDPRDSAAHKVVIQLR